MATQNFVRQILFTKIKACSGRKFCFLCFFNAILSSYLDEKKTFGVQMQFVRLKLILFDSNIVCKTVKLTL